MKIVITDCDHATIDAEQEAADAAGHELVLTQSATEEEVIANASGADALVVQYAPITAVPFSPKMARDSSRFRG